MLMYHPAFDANHCVYRILSILYATKNVSISWSLLRMMDFYYLFPSQLKNIKPWPRQIQKMKSIALNVPDQYEDLTNPARTFFELQTVQKTAILELMAKGVVSKKSFGEGIVKLEDEALSQVFENLLDADEFVQSDAFMLIVKGLPLVKFGGSQGLKYRSGLMEYVYDL